jgi:hypothetical protein
MWGTGVLVVASFVAMMWCADVFLRNGKPNGETEPINLGNQTFALGGLASLGFVAVVGVERLLGA